jgi:hypothetical protein
MRNVRVWLLTSCTVFLSACVFDSISGSGKVITENRTVAGFSNVSLSGSGQVVIEQTGTDSLTVTTDDNLLPYIKTEVRGDTLELGFTNAMTNVSPTKDIVFKLSVKQLAGLEVSGSGEADAKGINEDRLRIKISGSGEVAMQGTANDLDLSISGSGGYRGEGMKTKRAEVGISGSGRAVVAADDQLNANVSGSGSIEYIGDPQVIQHTSGSGSVQRR